MKVSTSRKINSDNQSKATCRSRSVMLIIFLVCLTSLANAEEQVNDASAIGTATLLPDGTLGLHLRAEEYGEDGELVSIGHAYVEYKPGDSDYEDILEHIGEIEIGQDKYVLPWKD